jgi:hypothetical protein
LNAEHGIKMARGTQEIFRVPRSEFFRTGLLRGFSLAEISDAVALFPLAALFEDGDALKALEHVAFAAQGGRGAETGML